MITRAYVTSSIYKDNDSGALKCNVYVPVFGENMEYDVLRNKNTKGLSAIISCSPNETPNFKEGDAVIVAFEEYLADSPIVIGWLFGSKDSRGDSKVFTTYPDAIYNGVTVGHRLVTPQKLEYISKTSTAKFNNNDVPLFDTSETKTIDLSFIDDLTDKVQAQINNLEDRDSLLNKEVKSIRDSLNLLIVQLETSGVLTNGYYSSASYAAPAGSEPYGGLSSGNTQPMTAITGD